MTRVFSRIRAMHESGFRPISIAVKFNLMCFCGREDWSEKLVRRVLTWQGITPRD